jgi:hypothetical protein
MILSTWLETWSQKLTFSRFMAVFWAIAHCFGLPAQFLGPMTLGARFERRRQKLIVFVFYGRFVGYSTLFWGAREISRARDTRYTV